jgi:hypothetical protein
MGVVGVVGVAGVAGVADAACDRVLAGAVEPAEF